MENNIVLLPEHSLQLVRTFNLEEKEIRKKKKR